MTVREPTRADAEALAELLNAQSLALHGTADLSADAMASWFGLPELEMLVAEDGGRLVAYADFVPSDDPEWAWIDLRQHPDEPRSGELLLQRFERRAAELGRAAARTIVSERDAATRELVESRGYRPIRYSFRMRTELGDDLPEPAFPDGIELRVMRRGEERDVWAAANDAFADHWGFHESPFDSWRQWNLDRDGSRPDLWWLATDGDEIAAVCLNRFADDGDPRHGYVHILGVRPAWRRRGLGEALLRHSFRDFRVRGCDVVTLDVDGENPTGAVRLYERVGMRVDRRADTYEKRLA
jgi:mycothiol synthase